MTESIKLTPKARKMTIFSMILLWFSFLLISSGQGNALPAKMAAIGGMEYYALLQALNGMGMMLCMPFIGKLTDIFGRKWITIVGALGYVLLFAIAATVENVVLFIVLCVLASVMGGMYNASPIVIISDVTSSEERPKYLGLISTAQAIGIIFGGFIGGSLVDAGFYKIAFVYGIPMMVLVVILMMIYYPDIKIVKTDGTKIDILGIGLIVLGIIGVIGYAQLGNKLFSYSSATGFAVLAFGIVCLVTMVFVELKKSNPAVPVRMFENSSFTVSFLANIGIIMYSVCIAGYILVYGQQIMQLSATTTATFTWPNAIALAVGGPIAGAILAKKAKRLKPMVILSVALTGGALFLWSFLTPASSVVAIYISTFVGGLGVGLANTSLTPSFQRSIDPSEYGAAQGMYGFAGKIGTVIIGCVLAALSNSGLDFGSALVGTFRFASIYCLAIVILAAIFLRTTNKNTVE